ncbi:MAG: hypothetical protein COA70_06430 [Planctomycetota bacterium]|nr:MAG: hypothetical protein COA70_06430 [Planctomycetota bacterium]
MVFVLAMLSDSLRSHILPWMRENGPVELATFAFAFVAGFLGLVTARKRTKARGIQKTTFFMYVFALGILVVALEEIAWGQAFFDFETPSYFVENNAQQEVTLHNLKGIHGASDYLYLVFGLAGLIGLWGFQDEKWRAIRVPKRLLALLLTITLGALFSIAQGIWQFSSLESGLGRKLAEVLELWVALTAFLYVWGHFRSRPKKS